MTEKFNKRDFLKKAGLATAGAVGASTLAMPYVKAQSPIRWRLQTYAGPALAEHVVGNAIEWFNTAANGEMVIELYTADQLVPHGELFRSVQNGTIDAAQSDDDSAAAPVDVKVFGAYFPLASRYSLDVPALWHWHGLKEIWEEAYAEIPGCDLALYRRVGPVQFRHHQADPLARGPAGPARLHLPDRRTVPVQMGRRAGVAAL